MAKILTDDQRTELTSRALSGGVRGALAKFQLRTDDNRRAAASAAQEAGTDELFDRKTLTATPVGFRGRGGGRTGLVTTPPEWRATTAQAAGFYPWPVGAGAPVLGTPLGRHLRTNAPVCFDPLNWQVRGGYLTAPIAFVLALNGFGKSTLVRRMVTGAAAQLTMPLILGDTKPDYVDLVQSLGGQVVTLGYGHGRLNPLDVGTLGRVVPHLPDQEMRDRALDDIRARQINAVVGLIELIRGGPVADFESTVIGAALDQLYTPETEGGLGFTPESPPIIEDLVDVLTLPELEEDHTATHERLMWATAALDATEYRLTTKPLQQSLRALIAGRFGEIFNGQTTTPLDIDAPAVCVDVSKIPASEKTLLAAVLLTTWSDGFGAVEAAHLRSDAGLAPARTYCVVTDEMWRVLGAGPSLVDRVDELTRLNRTIGSALIMVTHSIKDLEALGTPESVKKALGFLERARAKIIGPLPPEELDRLSAVMSFSATERDMVTSWAAPDALAGPARSNKRDRPMAFGTGKFLLKVGEANSPGIPFQLVMTDREREEGVHDTNKRFADFGRRGDLDER